MERDDAAKILGVDKNATPDEVKRAYKRCARRRHPDVRRGDPDAHRCMVEANEARSVLLAPPKTSSPGSTEGARSDAGEKRGRRRPSTGFATEPDGGVVRSAASPRPPSAQSNFFSDLGFVLRPTDGRTSFRVFASGVQRFTLIRHPENRDVLYCRDVAGGATKIDGVGFWFDDGDHVEPLRTETETRRAR